MRKSPCTFTGRSLSVGIMQTHLMAPCFEHVIMWWVDAGGRPCLDPCFRWVDQLPGLPT